MPSRACLLAPTLLVTACATVQTPEANPAPGPSTTSPRWIVLASAEGAGPALAPSQIQSADLVQARALLSKARAELTRDQWELLDGKLTEAESAWARYNALVREGGEVARVARGAEGVAEASRLSRTLLSLPRAGPLIVLLVAVWPSEIAEERWPPPGFEEKRQLQAKLKALALAAQDVGVTLEASQKTNQPPELDAAKKQPPKEKPKPTPKKGPKEAPPKVPDLMPDVSGYPPGKRPCKLLGTEGKALGLPPGISGPFKCTYNCGGKEEIRHGWGTSAEVWDLCEKLTPTW